MVIEKGILNDGDCLSKPQGSTKTGVETHKSALLQHADLLLILIKSCNAIWDISLK